MGKTEWYSSRVEFWLENEHDLVGCVSLCMGVGARKETWEGISSLADSLALSKEYWSISLTGSSVLAEGKNSLSRFLFEDRWMGLSSWYSIKWWHYNGQWVSESRSVMSDSLRSYDGPYNPWNSPGQITGVDSLSLSQGIFPTQGTNTGLLHCRQILYQLRATREAHDGQHLPRVVLCPMR